MPGERASWEGDISRRTARRMGGRPAEGRYGPGEVKRTGLVPAASSRFRRPKPRRPAATPSVKTKSKKPGHGEKLARGVGASGRRLEAQAPVAMRLPEGRLSVASPNRFRFQRLSLCNPANIALSIGRARRLYRLTSARMPNNQFHGKNDLPVLKISPGTESLE